MIVLQTIGVLYFMWLLYVLTMHVIAKWDSLPVAAKCFGAPAAIFAYVADVLLNATILTVLFVDLPKEWTITHRLHRYQKNGGWRAKPAKWVCTHLLNPFDAEHC